MQMSNSSKISQNDM